MAGQGGGSTGLGPFPAGVNNMAKEHQLPVDDDGNQVALREAVNVDLDNAGWPQRRRGITPRFEADRAHSLFLTDDYLFAVVEGDLCAFDDDFDVVAVVKEGLGDRYVSYALIGDDIYWTNGLQHRRIAPDLSDHPHAIETPAAPTVAASGNGGLAAGEYGVALTWRSADGRESGASVPLLVTVPANGGILLTHLPSAVEDAVTLRIYVTPPNDDAGAYYLAYELPAGVPTLLLGAHTPGKACTTLWHIPLPAGDTVRYCHGRQMVAAGPWLHWSPALMPGLMHQDSTMRFGEGITMLEPIGEGTAGAGIFVADVKRTYFLAGAGEPPSAQKSIRYKHAVVPGTSVNAPGDAFGPDFGADAVLAWLASNGVFCVGLAGGQVQPLTEGRLAVDGDSERGTATFREFDGIRQFLTSFLSSGALRTGVVDSAVATIRRNGVTVD